MNYHKIYDRLIERAKLRFLDSYTERHHIVPRCLGGSDDPNNIVALTPEEHYVAHQLLVKIYPDNVRLIKAATMMVPNRPSNKMYGWLRRKLSSAMSIAQSGNKNNQYGTRWVHNTVLQVSKKVLKSSVLEPGWSEGRIIKFDKKLAKNTEELLKKQRKADSKLKRNKEEYIHTLNHLKKFIESDYVSLNEYCSSEYEFSLVIFTKRCKKHFSFYNQVSKQGSHNLKNKIKNELNKLNL